MLKISYIRWLLTRQVMVDCSWVTNCQLNQSSQHLIFYSLLFQLPQQQPVVITLGPDSDSESDTEHKPQVTSPPTPSAALFGGLLDKFIKEQRETVEVHISF